ncbi:MAG: putative hydro-lyase [Candidatus Dormibacteraeota bacterium]|nr:putative hydro-lyase [Candidatus Dormibacteraeota bacterium]
MGVVHSPAALRAQARAGKWRGTTAGHCPAYQQANLVVLPSKYAADFAAFCSRNPKPCPLVEILPPGESEPILSAAAADIRTDVPAYRVYRDGKLAERLTDVRQLWTDDLVSFLLGCSHTFEHALIDAGVEIRHIACGTTVPMFVSSLRCLPAGRFHGPLVVTLRPIKQEQLGLVLELSARYPHAHGSPVHVGDPARIGITDLDHPDYGDPVEIRPGEIAAFWACGVTPQAVAAEARPELMITHEPGQMFVTDLPREAAPGSWGWTAT